MSLEWILLGLRVLAAAILYTFLGIAFYLIWRDLKQAANSPQLHNASASRPVGDLGRDAGDYQLRVVAANGNESWVVGEVLLLQPVTLLGRDAGNTIILHDALASARHARLSQTNGVWWLEDLDSSSGTILNDTLLSKPTSLTEGDVIGVGNLRFRLEASR